MDKQENIFYKKRKELNLTQVKLSKILHVERSSISRWESGETIPDISLLPKIADLYGVSIDCLLGREPEFTGLNVVNAKSNIGLIIKKLRESRHLTQKQLGQFIGVADNTVSQYEHGRMLPSDEVKKKLADFFKVSFDYLMGREPEFTGLNIVKPLAPLKKSEIQILFDALGPEEQASVLGYAKGFLARSGKDYKKIIAEAYRRNDISDNY